MVLTACAIRRGIVHEVERGQTLWRISQVYDVQLKTLMDVNDIENARRVKAGQSIVIPGASEPREVPASPQRRVAKKSDNSVRSDAGSNSTYESTSTPSSSESNDNESIASDRELSSSDETTVSDSRNSSPSTRETSPRSSTGATSDSGDEGVYFDPVWPCDGRLASRFDKEAGPSKRGIRIHTSEGSSVKAADGGNIKLAGEWDKMPDLGKIVIIFHSNDFTTVYAHLKSVKVSEGTTVERGESIGTVGRSGDVSKSMCYFEVRYKLEPRDPLIFLGEPS